MTTLREQIQNAIDCAPDCVAAVQRIREILNRTGADTPGPQGLVDLDELRETVDRTRFDADIPSAELRQQLQSVIAEALQARQFLRDVYRIVKRARERRERHGSG